MTVDIIQILPPSLLGSLRQRIPGELKGPCPWCGGRDRFTLWAGRPPRATAYFCRRCERRGDAIQLVREVHGIGYREACQMLGEDTDHQRATHAPKARIFAPTAQERPARNLPSQPSEKWQQAATAFLRAAQDELRHSDEGLDYLFSRHIPLQAALRAGIGWHGQDEYVPATAWGVFTQSKVRIPAGLVIATRRRSGVVELTVRRIGHDLPRYERYWSIRGGGRGQAFVLGSAGVPVFVFEGSIDAVAAWSNRQHDIAVCALGGSFKSIDDATVSFVRQAPLVVLCPDNDDAGLAGLERWLCWFPDAIVYSSSYGKDVCDMMNAACQQWPVPDGAVSPDVWVDAALAEARRVLQERASSSLPSKAEVAA